jgi:hypothetical protein
MNEKSNTLMKNIYKSVFIAIVFLLLFDFRGYSSSPVKILFIGNSYIYAGGSETDPGLPRQLKEMAEFYGQEIQYDFILRGGATLESHWKDPKALEKIKTGKFDYVVLQDQSTITLRNVNSFRESITRFDEAIRQSGARTVLYMTWSREGRPDMGDTISFEYNRIGKDLGAIVVPCGVAWKFFLTENPGSELHISDKSHPNSAGVFLNICVFYRTFFGKFPAGKVFTNKAGEKGFELARKMHLYADRAFNANQNYNIPGGSQSMAISIK